MSIIRLLPENFQVYDLIANPKKVFRSSSAEGITGSIGLFSDASPSTKDIDPSFEVSEEGFDDSDIEILRTMAYGHPGTDLAMNMEAYMSGVNKHPQSKRQNKRQEVLRFIPGARADKNHAIKNTVKKVLFPYYQHSYRNLDWGYTNYNCLHFFNSNTTPKDTALIYPAFTSSAGSAQLGDVNHYAPSASFTFDFYLKPKVSLTDPAGSEYHAGTILHMSSCYAISLVSGSSVGPDGKADKFRVLFQLSQSADISPSDCTLSRKTAHSTKGDPGFLFCSTDNSLNKNQWHHISIHWPGGSKNGGSGSISIDGKEDTRFMMLSSSVMAATRSSDALNDPDALFIGNYYQGNNIGGQSISRFFNPQVASAQGLTRTPGSGVPNEDPSGIMLSHPLQGEIHEIKIFNKQKSPVEINSLRQKGPELTEDLLFYVPPFFTQESRGRHVLQTPFMEHSQSATTNDPFNVALSFGVGGLDINLENFTREFVRKEYPRLHNMTSSQITTAVYEEGLTSDDILYTSGSAINRLYAILPCDNENFYPNFRLLQTSSADMTKFADEYSTNRLDLISLEDMVSTASLPEGLRSLSVVPPRTFVESTLSIPDNIFGPDVDHTIVHGTGSFLFGDIEGSTPEDPSVAPGSILTILQRTGDPSSNQIVFFDASNMFYGDQIRPGSVLIEDLVPTGSGGSFRLSLRDDRQGSIYRADTNTKTGATWASVGNVFYKDGIIVLKSPHLSLFGKDDFKITFEGERKVYVFEISVPVPQNLFNSSSNPQYKKLMPSNNFNEAAHDFSYITGVQLHDENFNIVGRAHLAQPFIKREEDRVVIKLRMDY